MREYPYIETRRGMPTVLYLEEGRSTRVRKINRGMFSQIYENLDAPEIFAVTPESAQDFSKEIVANVIDWRAPNPYLPKIQKLGIMSDDAVIYGMPKYRVPLTKGASAVAWSEAKVLQKCLDSATKTALSRHPSNILTCGLRVNEYTVACARESGLSKILIDALAALAISAANYGDSYVFEFPVRNLATDSNGHLVLLDVLYDMTSVQRIQNEQRREAFVRALTR